MIQSVFLLASEARDLLNALSPVSASMRMVLIFGARPFVYQSGLRITLPLRNMLASGRKRDKT